MPSLDVTQVLDCPEFYDVFEVERTTSTVAPNGENEEGYGQTILVQGVVVPASQTTLQRLADMANVSGSIEVYTRFRLNNNRGYQGADIIHYRGAAYTVLTISDFSSFGEGFVHAVCTLLDSTPEEIPG